MHGGNMIFSSIQATESTNLALPASCLSKRTLNGQAGTENGGKKSLLIMLD